MLDRLASLSSPFKVYASITIPTVNDSLASGRVVLVAMLAHVVLYLDHVAPSISRPAVLSRCG